jgi:hypothetical protein
MAALRGAPATAARRRGAWSQDSVTHLTAKIASGSLPGAGCQVRKNGAGPSTHEMEGPARSRRLELLAHAQRPCCSIRHRARYPPKAPVPRFPVRPGVAPGWCPFSAVRDFYARGQGPRKGFVVEISRCFSRPHHVHSSPGSYPLQVTFFHRKSTAGPRPCALPR